MQQEPNIEIAAPALAASPGNSPVSSPASSAHNSPGSGRLSVVPPAIDNPQEGVIAQMLDQFRQNQIQMQDRLQELIAQNQQLQLEIAVLGGQVRAIPVQGEQGVAPAVVPVVRQWPEVPTLENIMRDNIPVDDTYIINKPPNGALSEADKSNIKPPKLDLQEVNDIDSLMKFTRGVVHYFTTGGEKPITAFLSVEVMEILVRIFDLKMEAFVALSPQCQVYEFLKAFWRKPNENARTLIANIKAVELVPGSKKDSIRVAVTKFIVDMEKKLGKVEFTKSLLDEIKKQVFIKNWEADFKATNYTSYQEFFDHLKAKAFEYETSKLDLEELKSSKSKPNSNNKNGNGKIAVDKIDEKGKPGKRKGVPQCNLCNGEHWAFDLNNDWTKPYGDHIKWTCPTKDSYGKDILKAAWEKRADQAIKRKQKYAEKAARKNKA
jgi:hypothetical protein